MEITLDIQQSEKEFIQACIDQEDWAQQKIYEMHYTTMYPLCRRYACDDDEALDILHEGFIKVFRHISKYTIGTSLNAWIRRIMVNTAIDFYRKRSRQRVEDIDNARSMEMGGESALDKISAQEIIEALQELTPAYRSVFNLYIIEGYPHKEVARILNITESTSRSNLVKARSKLKAILLSKGTSYER